MAKWNAGDFLGIPLFVSEKCPTTRFSDRDFDVSRKSYCFARLISDQGSMGLIVEVFAWVGTLDSPLERVAAAGRLFPPCVITGLPIIKKRWPSVGRLPDYDPERHSQFSKIELALARFDPPLLWRGGETSSISEAEIGSHEHWVMWGAHQVEKRIIAALADRGLEWDR